MSPLAKKMKRSPWPAFEDRACLSARGSSGVSLGSGMELSIQVMPP